MIAITGARGQLGSELSLQLANRSIPLDLPEFNLLDKDSMAARVREIRPSVIINCAAYTQVDRAENDAIACRAVNETAVETLANLANELDALLVQISTDYVFCGANYLGRPFREEDAAVPRGVYALTKFGGEYKAALAVKHLIVRTCGLYCHTPGGPVRGRNFVDTMLALSAERSELRIVNDQTCTPTFVPHLARAIADLMDVGARGVVHVTNDGGVTWWDFAAEIFRLAQKPMQLQAITTAEYGAAAPRPPYSVLDTSLLSRLIGRKLPAWQVALAERLQLLA